MPHFAKLDENNIVTYVVVGRVEDDGKEDELTARTGDVYKQTSYNTYGGVHYTQELDENSYRIPSEDQSKAFRYNYASIGSYFDETRGEHGAFIPPKPFESWTLDDETCLWKAPVPLPEGADERYCLWDEENQIWIVPTD
jgi:hypothetical protein